MNVRARELETAVTLSEREAELYRCRCTGAWALHGRPCAVCGRVTETPTQREAA